MSVDPAAGSGPDRAAAPHADPDRLADLAEGLLAASDAAAVREHLASCPDCAADYALITESFDLAALLPAEPIPAEVTARVQAALDREPALTSPVTPVASPAPAAPARRHRFRLALTGLAAASVLGIAVAGVSTAFRSGVSESKASSGNAAVAPLGGPASGAVIGDARGAQQVALSLLHNHPFAVKPDENGGSTGGGTAQNPQAATGPLACVSGALATQTPLASTAVEFQGQPAWLLVYREPANPTEADVIVVPQSCPAAPANSTPGATQAGPSMTADARGPLLSTTVAIP